ncbi:lanthionine synthetase C family protein, partial [Streptomyces sp. T-3]|nr:lanthionine synthetase C family protein [Streptomyces sp. T-3]
RALPAGALPPGGIFKGPGALAFAVLIAHQRTGGYVSALTRLDGYQRDLVTAVLPDVQDAPLSTIGHYEVVRGLTGVGRYLLERTEQGGEALEQILRYLIHLARGTVEHQGHQVPRWWALDAPRVGSEASFPGGHLNLGLSHGVAGPLTLLALAWQRGIRLPHQQEAIESIADLLRQWAVRDEHGLFWPGYLNLAQWKAGPDRYDVPASWPAWCYGTPGVSRALQLAGLALNRDDFIHLARTSTERLLTRPRDLWGINDHALCHGWAGALHQLGRLNEHFTDPAIDSLRQDIAVHLLDSYDPDAPFGYHFTMTRVPFASDVSGYLDGAAGVALALDSYATQTAASGWDMPLLLS